MDSSFQIHANWIQARRKQDTDQREYVKERSTSHISCTKWQPPAAGTFKINVDASVFPGANNFSIGMVMRNYACDFMAARNCKISGEVSVFEAESVGVCEALSWIKEMQRQEDEIIIESDSQLSVNAIRATRINYLEVGEVIESCKQLLNSFHKVSVVFVRKMRTR
ncbi:uncharacterized protein LOC141661257 [Apium graveolens]|uniref:uncharacterized protein LOC141661257 n=1 Tax=Apium graveolens TaxID=4045 RepID=UPI003D7B460E